jgi:hypothetical protein
MSRLLRDKDYFRLVQEDNLDQITEGNRSIKLDVEQSAQTEMTSYLAQRYITANVFTDTTQYLTSVAYKAKALVEYTEPLHSASTAYTGSPYYVSATAYVVGNKVTYNGYIYTCILNSTGNLPTNATYWTIGVRSKRVSFKVGEDSFIYECILDSTGYLPTNATYWALLTEDLSLYYATLPYPEYDNAATYSVGTVIWYNNVIYTNTVACTGVIPTNTGFWSAGATYTIPAGTFPTDATLWTKGDNRNQQIVMYLVDITLYHLHSRINPRQIPDLRKERYDGNNPQQNGGAIAWLKRVAAGDLTADLPNIIPQSGLSISYQKTESFNNNAY